MKTKTTLLKRISFLTQPGCSRVASILLLCLAIIVLVASCAKKASSVTPLPGSRINLTGLSSIQGPKRALFGGGGGGMAPSPIFMPAPQEELWILARGPQPAAPADDSPGSGTLLAKIDQKEIPMPLKHTDVRASIRGYIGAVDVTQQFHNPYSAKIEAVYTFPLPHNAAVDQFLMTIGERRIRGIIRDRAEAEQIYDQAKRQGYVASLLTEERPNIFTQSVANIEPGKEIHIQITYFHTLDYVDGWYEFVFPMVVGPRFNPPGSTTGVGAVPRGSAGLSGQSTEIQYLAPNERTSHDISLSLDLDAGVPIEDFQCKTHETDTQAPAPNRLLASIKQTDSLPNKDFVFRYRVAGDHIKSTLITHHDQRGGFFTLMLYPPEQLRETRRQPLELVFVLDCSGSMSGLPIQQAKAAIERALNLLEPGDSFQLINFSLSASRLGDRPLEATPENVQLGLQHLKSLRAEGGTMMIEGIKAALDFPHDPRRLRFVCFLTDGYIGNETEILREIHPRLGSSRIFSFGIGSSVNRYLLDHMAKTGRGAVAYLGLREQAAPIMEDFFTRISHPALTDLAINWGALKITETYPRALPDLFVGRPVILTGRFIGQLNTPVRLIGQAAGQPLQITIPAPEPSTSTNAPGLPSLWARMKIADLLTQHNYRPDPELPDAVKQLALDYNLVSPFTAFVAVDSSRVTAGTEATTVPVAVPVPEGVKYQTTVPESP